MLWSVVWFHTKSKPHNDCHKSGFFTTVFWLCDCHCRPSPLHCNYPFHQANSIPAYLINVDANTSTVGSQYRGVDGLRSRCLPSQSTPKSDMWIEDHQEAIVHWQFLKMWVKRIVFCPFLPFFVFAIEVHFWFRCVSIQPSLPAALSVDGRTIHFEAHVTIWVIGTLSSTWHVRGSRKLGS